MYLGYMRFFVKREKEKEQYIAKYKKNHLKCVNGGVFLDTMFIFFFIREKGRIIIILTNP